jgi:hypothetical protein
MTTHSPSPNYLSYSNLVSSNMHSQRGYMDHGTPDYLVLDIADLVRSFEANWNIVINSNMHNAALKPNMHSIVAAVINSIRQEADAELELATMAYADIASLAQYEIPTDPNADRSHLAMWDGTVEQYNDVNVQLSNLTVRFGKAVISRFKQETLYHHGYLPYKFQGWVGSTVYLAFDKSHTCSTTVFHKELQHASLNSPTEGFPYV